MSPSASSPGAAPLPPLPNLSGAGGGQAPGADSSSMANIMSGIAPVKAAVDQMLMSCKQIVQSGAVPGAEQVCGQIVALATSLLPMAVQSALQPGQGGSIGPVGAGQSGPPAPSGPPQAGM